MSEDEFGSSSGQEKPEDQHPQVSPIFPQIPIEEILEELFNAEQIKDPHEQSRRIRQILEEIDQTAGTELPDEEKSLDYDQDFAKTWELDPYQTAKFSERSKKDHAAGTPETIAHLERRKLERESIVNGQDSRAFSPTIIVDTLLHLLPVVVGTATVRSIINKVKGNK